MCWSWVYSAKRKGNKTELCLTILLCDTRCVPSIKTTLGNEATLTTHSIPLSLLVPFFSYRASTPTKKKLLHNEYFFLFLVEFVLFFFCNYRATLRHIPMVCVVMYDDDKKKYQATSRYAQPSFQTRVLQYARITSVALQYLTDVPCAFHICPRLLQVSSPAGLTQ